MPNRDVSEPYLDNGRPLGGNRNHAEDEPDLEGYDEAQRAEIAEVEGGGPNDGNLITDLDPDLGGDIDADEIEDDEDELPEERDGGF